MADAFIGEIRIFPFNFAPVGWAQCNGQLLPIAQNTALFALLGTVYGGDGKTTFALPNLRASVPMHTGLSSGPGLSGHTQGETGGSATTTLLDSQIPAHSHTLMANSAPADLQIPASQRVLARSSGASAYQTNSSTNLTQLAPQTLAPAGGGQPHNNMQPYLAFNFCIALQGIFPARS